MNITLKNIPEKIYREMRREAKRQGRSLNAQIIRTLEDEAAEIERRRRMTSMRKKLDLFAASLPPMEDSTSLIRSDRQR